MHFCQVSSFASFMYGSHTVFTSAHSRICPNLPHRVRMLSQPWMAYVSPLACSRASRRVQTVAVQNKRCRSIPCCISRREAALLTAVTWAGCQAPAEATSHSANSSTSSVYLTAADAAPQQSSSLLQAANRTTGSNLPCDIRLDPSLAAAFTAAVYDVVKQQGIVSEKQLQMERFKLQNREYKYYAEANKARMPQLPDLDDNSGGLSNRLYYNFVSYCLWKTVAKHLTTPEQRTQFCATVGKVLLMELVPETVTELKAARTGAQPASFDAVVSAIESLLAHLQLRGYLCGHQLVLGSQPGTWPADWATSQPQLLDEFGLLTDEAATNVDLKQQENGSDSGNVLVPGTVFQVKLLQPADIEGSVALRAEEDGFWSRHVSSMLLTLLFTAGYNTAAVDEYFYQDYWQGPSRTADKLLLLFGDPLQQVEVPWTPTSLVQNWTIV